MARVFSLWIFDRHCNPIYHQDWSHLHQPNSGNPLSPSSPSHQSSGGGGLASIGATFQRGASNFTASQQQQQQGGGSNVVDARRSLVAQPVSRPGRPSIPGVTRSSQPSQAATDQKPSIGGGSSRNVGLPFDEEAKLVYGVVFSLRNMVKKLGGSGESFNSYTTLTYTLGHLQTPTMYTFVILTDPIPPPSSISAGGRSSEAYSIGSSGGGGPRSTFGTGGGIPGTGGMSLKGVLLQIWKGPWLDSVTRNPLMEKGGVEREERQVEQAEDLLEQPRTFRMQRETGIDCQAFREGVERVLTQNKLFSNPSSSNWM
ncbi:hypothetical protein IE53DRAFT_384820 [Violaceomyces palustris]|uniref:Uncharacterized protein n=1 Tax=Violaceomyces palustris TaxID=1673888 RepID=A0ACD0P3T2_9BASI|nr:hypothetical protein IE53DRAFT_384820 [Violaceomyces palustris]